MNWKKFSQHHFSREVFDVIKALDLEIPPEGRPLLFVSGEFYIKHLEHMDWWLVGTGTTTKYLPTKEALEAARGVYLTKGTPTGDALRFWMSLWTPAL